MTRLKLSRAQLSRITNNDPDAIRALEQLMLVASETTPQRIDDAEAEATNTNESLAKAFETINAQASTISALQAQVALSDKLPFTADHSDGDFSLAVAAGVRTKLTLDMERIYYSGPDAYDGHDFFQGDKFIPIGDEAGGEYEVRLALDVTPSVVGTVLTLELDIGIFALTKPIPLIGSGGVQAITEPFSVYTGNTFVANGAEIYVTATEAVTVSSLGVRVKVERVK